jgi:hypothetical protein
MNSVDIKVRIHVPGWRARVAEALIWLALQILRRGLTVASEFEPSAETPVGVLHGN